MTARLFINKFLNEKMGSLLFCYKGYRRVILACSVCDVVCDAVCDAVCVCDGRVILACSVCVIRKAHMGSLLGVGR